MIEIRVKLENDFDTKEDVIEISKEEILQLACNYAKEKYPEGKWNYIFPVKNEIIIKL